MCQAFEWVVHDVAKLRDFVEDSAQDESPGPERDEFEILRESPILGDGKYKLEIGTKHAPSPSVPVSTKLFSADDARCRDCHYSSAHAFLLRYKSRVGLRQRRVRDISINVSCD